MSNRGASPLTVGVAGLAVGLVAGYLIPRGGEIRDRSEDGVVAPQTSALAPASDLRSSHPVKAPTRSEPSVSQTVASDNLLQSIPPHNDYSARAEWVRNLPQGEIPSLVAGLCADVGPSGLEYEDRRLIDEALEKWWKADSVALLEWLKQLPNGGTKRYLVSSLLQDLARNDPSRAAALAESFKAQDPDWNDSELQDNLVKQDVDETWKRPGVTADEMLQLYSRFSRGNITSGERVGMYPLDFDFRKFLDGMNGLRQQDGKNPAQIPSDTLEAWAKIDPEAAVQWFVESESMEPHGGVYYARWEQIASGIAATSGPQAYHQWAADIVGQPQQGKLRDLILQHSSDADLLGIIEKIGNVAQRDDALAFVVGNSSYWRSEDNIEKLALISTPEARLRVIAQNPDRFGSWIKRGMADPSFWPRAGLTTEQVSTTLSTKR